MDYCFKRKNWISATQDKIIKMNVLDETSLLLRIMLLLILHLCLHWCYAFVLFSSTAAAGSTKLFEAGTGHSYQLTTTIVLNEPTEPEGKDVGYQIQSDVSVEGIWQNSQDKNEKLVKIEVNNPKLLIRSKETRSVDGFTVHKSDLSKIKSFPFLIHWKLGKILNVFMDVHEDESLANHKKGIASLFQFQEVDSETKETDASGHCQVVYKSIKPFSYSKTKIECLNHDELPHRINSNPLLRANVTSTRTATYELSNDLSFIKLVTGFEHHKLIMNIKREAGGSVSATQHLVFNGNSYRVASLKSSSLENAVKEFENAQKLTIGKRNLFLQNFSPNCDKEDCPSLPKLLRESREYLTESNLGTFKSASAFVKLLSVARASTKADLTKAFKGSKNKEILSQLCDLAGAIQSKESHELMMRIINFDSDKDFDASERYLWALSTGYYPNEFIIRDIFKISLRSHPNEKLDETLVLTLASMANRFHEIPGNQNSTLFKDIADSITGELEICKTEVCKIKYLRALKNLRYPKTIPVLIKYALNGNSKTSVEAIKGLRSFQPEHWTDDVIDAAQRIYFQVGKKFDSSSKTLAIDILVESNPRREILQELLLTLVGYDSAYEVKQYLVQRINQIAERNYDFAKTVNSIKKEFFHLFNNYNVHAQRGLTTAFTRDFVKSDYRNGSLSTVLEISKGLLKRGIVDVVIENAGRTSSLFTLGLFAEGLSSFVSSDGDQEEDNDVNKEEVASAGMELTVLGSQIRPFVFFSGHGELMGHVWSGTASEKTPAYQTMILVIDHFEHIPLQSGFLVQIEVLGAVSFDLSGQIQISLWNKNAHSLVEKSAGISLQGLMKVDSSFVRSMVEFNVGAEMKLNLQSDLNFYGGNSLCMQLSQPEVVIKHNIHKIERIPRGKHRLRKSKYSQTIIPGRTYVLNKKNNEMCKLIFH